MKSIYLLTIFLGVCCTANVQKHKRQIYREQVLPALGGKIPEEAFRTDRLALNRLNKDGIAVIDGILLEARDHEKNPDNVRTKPEIIQVYVTQDSRYVPPEGRYHNERPRSIDTTYVIRSPVGNHDKGEHQRFNGIGNVPAHYNQHNINNNNNRNNNNNNNNRNNNNNNINNNNNNNNNCNNNNKNGGYGNGGYRKQLEIPPRGLSPPKAQGYANFYRRLPPPPKYRSGQSQQQQQQHQQYQTIYKPIITPLVIPARDLVITKPYHVIGNNFNDQRNPYQSWDFSYDWNTFYNQQLSEPFLLGDSFDSHQIITDYEGFLNAYHGRSYRHVGASKDDEKRDNLSKDFKDLKTGSSLLTDDRGRSTNIRGEKKESTVSTTISRRSSLAYTDLTRIPETSFTCDGKKGTFADVETKCQVFHECSGWSKTSSLCPAGTAYSPSKKRCEWWNTVTCGSD